MGVNFLPVLLACTVVCIRNGAMASDNSTVVQSFMGDCCNASSLTGCSNSLVAECVCAVGFDNAKCCEEAWSEKCTTYTNQPAVKLCVMNSTEVDTLCPQTVSAEACPYMSTVWFCIWAFSSISIILMACGHGRFLFRKHVAFKEHTQCLCTRRGKLGVLEASESSGSCPEEDVGGWLRVLRVLFSPFTGAREAHKWYHRLLTLASLLCIVHSCGSNVAWIWDAPFCAMLSGRFDSEHVQALHLSVSVVDSFQWFLPLLICSAMVVFSYKYQRTISYQRVHWWAQRLAILVAVVFCALVVIKSLEKGPRSMLSAVILWTSDLSGVYGTLVLAICCFAVPAGLRARFEVCTKATTTTSHASLSKCWDQYISYLKAVDDMSKMVKWFVGPLMLAFLYNTLFWTVKAALGVGQSDYVSAFANALLLTAISFPFVHLTVGVQRCLNAFQSGLDGLEVDQLSRVLFLQRIQSERTRGAGVRIFGVLLGPQAVLRMLYVMLYAYLSLGVVVTVFS